MTETIPPITAEELSNYLENESFSVYLFLGHSEDKGWKCAQIIYGLLARLRVYLVKDPELVSSWISDNNPTGIVFGWGPEPKKFLNAAEADDLETVLESITEARS